MSTRPPSPRGPHKAVLTTVGAAGIAEIAVHGSWSHRLGTEVTVALRDCFADRPGIIVDLHAMNDDAAASLPLWLAARRVANVLRAPVHLALCLPAATLLEVRLRRIGAHRLPLYATMAEARAAVTAPSVG
ncbi:MAG TPA: hypothetical protein VN408_00250 [Actinoplanes sp.]|nr:hypothetical protein [Actinoplanes sp.]